MKFERKLYQVFGLPLGRPIRFKSILYAIVIGLIEISIYFTPFIGALIRWIPVGILIIAPMGLAWLLADVGTEDRSSLSYFRSFILYNIRKFKGDTYFRNRNVQKEMEYQFNNYFSYESVDMKLHDTLKEQEVAKKEQEKALRYIERITNPSGFFAEMEKERAKQTRKRKRLTVFKKGA